MPFSVQRWLQIVLRYCTALQAGRAYLVKQHVSFACMPPSAPAQMINLIQLRVAGLRLNPIMLWCFVAIETSPPPPPPFFSLGFLFYLQERDEKSCVSFIYAAM